ncbi:MAG: tRNA (N6-threonylcarbamoyladenosine(37)-N6)-methyltransferase TrmO [Desulfobacterales bacterium]|nr:tRNA (N6-threonylcarbamoyladenosine(37)-N6)-methyltransferase TrmO [Deltaproteobacteria bacterium]NNL43283.1 tRNA (N6-threonylcarbamoyladenosine(37)-N6)-methyltransferase TrmO [Desulfobacterales bacterium]
MKIEYNSIGIVHTPFKDLDHIPNQPSKAKGTTGVVEVYPKYQKGLKDLDGYSHIILLCHFHRISDYNLDVVPSGETISRGLFATRSPRRPNPIGFSVVRLNEIRENRLMISNVDILDNTPVLDIKPYFPEFKSDADIKTGWLNKEKLDND